MRVTFVARLDAGLFYGGGELQLLRTRQALEALGVEVNVHAPFDREMGEVVHFFGPFAYFWEIAEVCLERKIPYVWSPIYLAGRRGIQLSAHALRRRLTDRRELRSLRRLARGSAATLLLSSEEDRRLTTFLGEPPLCPHRVPNGIEPRFFEATPELFRERTGIEGPFVLHTGRFEPRKNQLRLIHALRDSSLSLVLIGLKGSADYEAACRREAGPNVHFLDPIPHDDPLLPSAYAAARVFCLPSGDEILSLSGLEAGAAGCAIVLGRGWGAEEHFGPWARLVEVESVASIRQAVLEAWDTPREVARQQEYFRSGYSWQAVAAQIDEIYQKVSRCG